MGNSNETMTDRVTWRSFENGVPTVTSPTSGVQKLLEKPGPDQDGERDFYKTAQFAVTETMNDL